MTDIEQHVDVVFIFEIPVEANNVFMLQRSMNFDFAGEFLSGFAFGEPCFRYNFQSPSFCLMLYCLDRSNAGNFICFRKATLAQKASLSVGDDLSLQRFFVSVVF